MEATRRTRRGLTPVTRGVLLAGPPALALAAYTENPEQTALSVAALMVITLLTWRPDEPPVLLFVSGMQWLQASLKVFHADLLGEPLWTMSSSRSLEQATTLTLLWVVMFALGARLSLARGKASSVHQRPTQARGLGDPRAQPLRPEVVFRLYLGWTLALALFERIAPAALRQAVVAAADLRWALVFAIFWMVLRTRSAWHLLLLVFVIEFVAGALSFFSDFKRPVYLLAIAFLAADYRLRLRHAAGFVLVASFAIYLGVLWSAVKQDYRSAINEGTGEQVVTLDRSEQLSTLVRLLGTVDAEIWSDGVDALVERIAYTEYFGWVLDHVPAIEEYAEGDLHIGALQHVLMPRILFPDKEALESDTLVAERYTGLYLVSEDRQTSISIGTPADAYVDFGATWMHLSALFFGVLAGLGYRVASNLEGRRVLSVSMAVAVLLPLATLELSVVKFLGGHVTRVIAALLLTRFALPLGLRLLTRADERHDDARTPALPWRPR